MFETTTTTYVSSLLLILMGTMDCITTVIGILYFETVELNPIIAGLISTNITAFVVVKLLVTLLVGILFLAAQKTLLRAPNKNTKSYHIAENMLKGAFVGITVFLLIVVINNI